VELTMRDHLDLLTSAMADTQTHVLMLGRPGNARWVTGADTLWLSGTRGFAPSCVVVHDHAGRSGGEPASVHLLSTTDDGVPADVVPLTNLFPLSWNPMNLMRALVAIPGVASATRIGVDSMTPTMEQMLSATFPNAQFVDGESLLRAVRRVKSDADVAGVRAAVALAEECMRVTLDALTPGVQERELLGVFEEHMASRGVSTPAFEGAFVVADGAPRSLVTDRVIAEGAVVHLRGGVLREGWEGWLSRTAVCGASPTGAQRRAFDAWRAARDRVLAACRAGATVGDVRDDAAGVTVDGVGMGHEELADADTLDPGVVLAVEATVEGVVGSETVLVTGDGPELLTSSPQPLS
jgi:Xaa-Pro dipeptidase